MTAKLVSHPGKGQSPQQRAGDLVNKIKDLVYTDAKNGQLPLAMVIGALEIVKHELLTDHEAE